MSDELRELARLASEASPEVQCDHHWVGGVICHHCLNGRITTAAGTLARAYLAAASQRDELRASLEEILDYQGGADSALDDEHVVERARAAIRGETLTEGVAMGGDTGDRLPSGQARQGGDS